MGITTKSSFRVSKSSKKIKVRDMEFYLSYPKSDKGVISIYDTNTGMLIAVNTKTVEEAENWINDNYYEILKRISIELGV